MSPSLDTSDDDVLEKLRNVYPCGVWHGRKLLAKELLANKSTMLGYPLHISLFLFFSFANVQIEAPARLFAQDASYAGLGHMGNTRERLNPTIFNKFHDVVAPVLKFVGPKRGNDLR
jgi:hypothetical protein